MHPEDQKTIEEFLKDKIEDDILSSAYFSFSFKKFLESYINYPELRFKELPAKTQLNLFEQISVVVSSSELDQLLLMLYNYNLDNSELIELIYNKYFDYFTIDLFEYIIDMPFEFYQKLLYTDINYIVYFKIKDKDLRNQVYEFFNFLNI